MELKKLTSDRRRIVKVPVSKEDGEVEFLDLAIWHKPLTPALNDQLDELKRQANAIVEEDPPAPSESVAPKKKDLLIQQLALLLTRWDITHQGQPVIPDEEALAGLEFEVLVAIQDALFEPIYPKKEN
ncbi:MAG: hypothetical protein JNK38_01215 [Acidobacteria bacterium]|nr:hypothetical protein [Acidobacteriota bacterium]